jgi:proton-dependent oligopeptide transporter, POT family
MSTPVDATGVSPVPTDTGFFGHPRGLSTLFFTEMWERFSFYGLRAILFLYMTTEVARGGLAFPRPYAGLIMATYASSVYWTPLIGGWLADKWLGARRAVFIGGVIIACGHFSMAIESMPTFYAGLTLIAIGTGFLKPNVSTMVGDLYPEGDARRDAGFSIFYMGINLGALLAPLVVGYLGQRVDWHYGFGAAGVFMVLGLIQYVLGKSRLRGVGERPLKSGVPDIAEVTKLSKAVEGTGFDYVTAALTFVGGLLGFIGGVKWGGAGFVGGLFPGVMFLFFGYILGTIRKLNRDEVLRVGVIFILFVFSVIFWMSFEQAATSLTLFADRLTRLNLFGFSFPSSWYQSVQPTFVVLLAPVFAGIWVKLGRRNPSSPGKFALGLLFAGIAFAIVAFASTFVPSISGDLSESQKVGPLWLVVVYFFQTLGELCLSPVGLSTVTKVSPARLVGLMMGVWFLSISIGNFIAGIMGGAFNEKAEGALVSMFGTVAAITFGAAALLAVLTPLIKKMTPRSA